MQDIELPMNSPEDLAALLEKIGLKLHAQNRIVGCESAVMCHLAEPMRKLGKLVASSGEKGFWDEDGPAKQLEELSLADGK